MPAQKMVRVKLNCARAGHVFDTQGRCTGTFAQSGGDTVEMPADEAERNVNSGLAQYAPLETTK